MPFYAGPLVRPQAFPNGRARGRRPFGYDQSGHNFVVVDPGDKTQPESGLVLSWFDDPIADRRLEKIADGKDEPMAVSAQAKLGAKLGRSFKSDPFNVQIAKALNLPPQVDGRVVVWLGPGGRGKNEFHVEQTPKVKHSKAWADTFTRSDGALNGSTLSGGGATWSSSGWAVASNTCQNTGMADDTFDPARLDTDADTDSTYSQATLTTFTPGNVLNVLIAAVATNQASDGSSGYGFQQVYEAATEYRQIFSVSDEITLEEDLATAVATGVMLIQRNGSSLEGFLDAVSVLGPVTVNTQASGAGNRRCGFSSYFAGTLGTRTLVFDSYLGGDIVTATTKHFALLGVG